MGLFLESERIASRSSHSQGGHAHRHSSHMGISGLGWCLATNVCALSVGTIPNSVWYNITSNTLLGWGRLGLLQRVDVFVSQDHFPEFPKKTSLQWLGKKICQHLFRGTVLYGNALEA